MSKTLKDRLKEVTETKKISFLEVERQTGIKANRMYKWYQQGTNPKSDDAVKLNEWLNSLEKSTNKQPEERGTIGYIDISMSNLTESNKVLSDANKTLAEANKTLADANLVISKNHEELIQLTKLIVSNSKLAVQVAPTPKAQHKAGVGSSAEDFLPAGTNLSDGRKRKAKETH